MAKYQVLRKFNSNRPHEVGEIVDLDGINIQKLVDQRYLSPVKSEPAPVSVSAEPAQKKPRGRPKGSKNRPKTEESK